MVILDVDSILIPEHFVRIGVNTKTFNKYMKHIISKNTIIHRYRGLRYIFIESDYVVEELSEENKSNNVDFFQ